MIDLKKFYLDFKFNIGVGCLIVWLLFIVNGKLTGQALESDLLMHMNFNNNINDLSSHSIDCTGNDFAYDLDRFGNSNNAIKFTQNSELFWQNALIYQVQYPFSFSAWINVSQGATNINPIFDSNFEENNYQGIMVDINFAGKFKVNVGNGNGSTSPGNRRTFATTESINFQEWTHIAGILEENGNVALYINGCKEPHIITGTGSNIISYNESKRGQFGISDSSVFPQNPIHRLIGLLDDFYFWNRAITEEEVLFLYDRFHVPEDLGLDEEYMLCSDQGAIEIDEIFTDVLWSDGTVGNVFQPSEAGEYFIEGYYNCHQVLDTIRVDAIERLPIEDEYVLCEGKELSLNLPTDYTGVVWSNGAEGNTIIINESGIYTVMANIDGCDLESIFEVKVLSLELPIEEEYVICSGESVSISLPEEYTGVIWSDGQVGNDIEITEAGTYTVLVSANGCQLEATLVVEVKEVESIHIEDHFLCDEAEVEIYINSNHEAYIWSDGNEGNDNIISEEGQYYVIGLQNGCYSDTSFFTVYPYEIENVALEDLYVLCNKDTLKIELNADLGEIHWSNGMDGNTIFISSAGAYSVEIENEKCGNLSYEFIVEKEELLPEIVDSTITKCFGESIKIAIPSFDGNIYWSVGDTTNEVTLSESGSYLVKINNRCYKDSAYFELSDVQPLVVSTDMIQKCRLDTIQLSAPQGAVSVEWSNGAKGEEIIVVEEGIYSFDYSYKDCLFTSDDIVVEAKRCQRCNFQVPNIFSPNGDKNNDELPVYSIYEECYEDFIITVYDRWGNKVYDSPVDQPWNGLYQEKQVMDGVYIYIITDGEEVYSGSITVVK